MDERDSSYFVPHTLSGVHAVLKASLKGQVRQTSLPKWKPLLPLFEAVMNALQATREARRTNATIRVEIIRSQDGLLLEEQPPISGFRVSDNGVGLNDTNFDSFNTAFSEYKLDRGGKGLGRFIWLKAFERVEIRSIFSEPDHNGLLGRTFTFDVNYDPDVASAVGVGEGAAGTVVELSGFREPYRSECPKTAEQICQRLVEHFLLVFLQPDCPTIEVWDGSDRIVANQVFQADFRASASANSFELKGQKFEVHGFRLTSPRASKHRLLYAANDRGVVSDNLEDFIPNLSGGRLSDETGATFVYLAVVQSSYLNQRVNNARTDFDIASGDDAEAEQPGLFAEEIKRSEIREACLHHISSDLAGVIDSINSAKEERILKYVGDEAPQYRILIKYLPDFIDKIAPNSSKIELEAALHRELHLREIKLKQEGSKIIKEADKIDDYEEYHRRLSDFMDRYNELGVSALAQYVAHRRIVLDFLERAISRPSDGDQYPLERAVHHLIFPMRTTSEDIPSYQQNLWIIDERLTYHSFIASDKTLNSIDAHSSTSAKRPDLVVFDQKVAFTDGEQPINSIVVVEFKRPQRDDYKPGDNPLSQAFDMVHEIRSGHFKDARGRQISVATDRIPATCFVICDLTPSLEKVLLDIEGAEKTPDGQGYYGFHRRRGIYYEVIDYNKLLRDAQKRNRAFIDKLNLT